jgi:predicted dehydrogenase
MIGLGIIGCGAVVHRNYSRVLIGRDEYRVRYVCDTDEQQAASAASLFSAEPVALEELLRDSDAIIVSTPPATHAELIRRSVSEGRKIICEKPYAPTHAEAAQALEDARAAGASLYIGQFRRAFPQLELARDVVRLGLIGEVESFIASEGGRFTWTSVSGYTTRDPNGGVLWDTGSHTLDMALYASNLDQWRDPTVEVTEVSRDRPEPSHDFRGAFTMSDDGRSVRGRLHLSRREALPNLVRVVGSAGELAFVTDVDNRLRVTTATGSLVLTAERSHGDVMECFDLQVRRVLLGEGDEQFAAEGMLAQVKVLEALTHAA